MQEACDNCFGLKKRNAILCQAKTGKHQYRNITTFSCTYILALMLTCFCLTKGRVICFTSDSVILQSDHQSCYRRVAFEYIRPFSLLCILART